MELSLREVEELSEPTALEVKEFATFTAVCEDIELDPYFNRRNDGCQNSKQHKNFR